MITEPRLDNCSPNQPLLTAMMRWLCVMSLPVIVLPVGQVASSPVRPRRCFARAGMMTRSRSSSRQRLVYVTVGTTKFDSLIEAITTEEALEALRDQGFHQVLLQIGAGAEPKNVGPDSVLNVEYYRFKDSLREDMEAADLIISHGGAGTIMEGLGLKKPMVVVINQTLMDDHQQELAHALADKGHVFATVPEELLEVLESCDLSACEPREPVNPSLFPALVDVEMGFALDSKSD